MKRDDVVNIIYESMDKLSIYDTYAIHFSFINYYIEIRFDPIASFYDITDDNTKLYIWNNKAKKKFLYFHQIKNSTAHTLKQVIANFIYEDIFFKGFANKLS